MELRQCSSSGYSLVLQVNFEANNRGRCSGTAMRAETELEFIALGNEVLESCSRHRDNEGRNALGMILVLDLVLVLDRNLDLGLHVKENSTSTQHKDGAEALQSQMQKVVPA